MLELEVQQGVQAELSGKPISELTPNGKAEAGLPLLPGRVAVTALAGAGTQ
jgi:hypothetical protein